ncbi:hypothetical protein [Marininema halotolerans]|uniref:Uncharacterized protein n=1 Tax=Marininema halotolerans TaxID=1155944 RepID=A0A1I6ULJ8_9BACL|nr:hypothetical protein [Marininema halotolerans]SFT02335.1 hypothetical protein SAMN05444972_1187 [Marininema halotolerans]
MEIFQDKVVCPRCNGNGLIFKAKISELDLIIYVCDECDATWGNEDDILFNKFSDLSIFINNFGLNEDEVNINIITYYWYSKNKEN